MKIFINKKITLIVLIFALLLFLGNIKTYAVDNEIDEISTPSDSELSATAGDDASDTTDFKNATFELKKDGVLAYLEISGVTPKSNHAYNLMITNSSSTPSVPTNIATSTLSLIYQNNKFRVDVTKYVELNQDLYAYILESSDGTASKYTFANSGKKLTRYEEPKYSDAFNATFVGHDQTQIVTNFTHSSENTRKLQVKIGKITDSSILQKIKNKDSSGFSNLLTYAKSNSGIYNQTLSTTLSGFIGYDNRNSGLGLTNVENDGYYYLYVSADSENGKYFPVEAVTLARAKINSNEWTLFFYGTNNFSWADFGNTNNNEQPSNNNDGTQSNSKLPYTGKGFAIFGILSLLSVSCVIFYKKFDYLKGIK